MRQLQSPNQNRDTTINIRAHHAQRALIDTAAEVLGKSRSEFVLDIACREARSVLLEQRLFELDDQRFTKFMERLDAPPVPNEKLQKLMATKAPWE